MEKCVSEMEIGRVLVDGTPFLGLSVVSVVGHIP
jgi:hypothetical protein